MTALLLLATILVPLGMLAACIAGPVRARMPWLLPLAPLPGLAAALLCHGAPPFVLDAERLRFTLGLDGASALLLGVASLLWCAAGAYAGAYLGKKPGAQRFTAWWLLTMSGSLGVFVAGDLASFYFTFAVVSLSAYALVVHDGTPRARRAGSVYLLLAVLGEICLLLGFALLAVATPGESIAIRDTVAALPASPWRDLTIVLLLAGFGLKAGLVPLHVWLPLAHPAAPMPASAVLSGVIIKAGIIGLIRFLPYDGSLPGWGETLAVLGLFTAFYGVAVGVTQANPKTVLAYSSVSQMGVVMAALGMGMAAGNAATPMDAAFYASHHVLAKGALFLAVGVAYATGRRGIWFWPVLLLVLSFGGLPFTGGALAKAAVKDQLDTGLAGVLAALSATGTTMLMLHFTRRLAAGASGDLNASAGLGLVLPWLVMTLAAVIVPWMLFLPSGAGKLADVVGAAALAKAIWPVLLGAVLAAALHRWGCRLVAVPEGDVLIFAERGFSRAAPPLGRAVDRLEIALRVWPNAGLALLVLVIGVGVAILVSVP